MSKAQINQYFYQGATLAVVKQDDRIRSIFLGAGLPLAEQRVGSTYDVGLLAINDRGSVLKVRNDEGDELHIYSAYGYAPTIPSPFTILSFNRERLDASSHCYMLGNGYRSFSPTLMRFHRPDNLSPFGKGG